MRRCTPLLAAIVLAGCSIGGSDEGSDSGSGLAAGGAGRTAGALGPDGGGGLASVGAAPTSSQRQAAEKLGFPVVATRNTVRVGGGDAIADLAGVASAVFPGTNVQDRPHAVVLVDKDDWQGAVAGAVLDAQPLG